MVFAEKGQFDIAKDLFTQVSQTSMNYDNNKNLCVFFKFSCALLLLQVQEAASGSSNVQTPDVWINLAHVHFAQGNFALAVKMVCSEFSSLIFY